MKSLYVVMLLLFVQQAATEDSPLVDTLQDADSLQVGDSVLNRSSLVDSTIADTTIDTLLELSTDSLEVSQVLPYTVKSVNVYNLAAKDDACIVNGVCDDKEHFSVRVQKGGRYAIHYPSITKQFYELVGMATFSPDCQHIAYGVYDGRKSYLYVDNKKINKDFHPGIKPKYNFDGSHLLYFKENWNTLSSKPRRIIVVDSTEYKFDKLLGTHPVTWSPNKKYWASLVKKGKKSFLVLNGARGPAYQGCTLGPYFSYDSKKVAYTAFRNDTCYLAIASEENGTFGNIFANKKSKKYYEKNKSYSGNVTSAYQELGGYRDIYGFMFIDSSYEFVMKTVMNYDHYVETIDTTFGPYDTTFSLVFDDNNNIAFTAKKGKYFLIKKFDNTEVRIDTAITSIAVAVRNLKYSDDYTHYAYIVDNRDETENLYVDDSLIAGWKFIYYAKFYPNSDKFYYFASQKKKSVSLITDKQELKYSYISPVLTSSDGSVRVAEGVVLDGDDDVVYYDLIINEKVYQKYSDIDGFTEFDADDNLILFVTKNKKRIYKLTISPNTDAESQL